MWVLAFATGALVANLYYAQPLIDVIGPAIGLSPSLAGLMVSLTQIGYGLGLFLLVSLADLVENKKLVLITVGITAFGLLGMSLFTSAALFFLCSFVIGFCSVGAQVIVPFAAHMVSEKRRGQTLGFIMGALLTGIMLARPFSLWISGSFGWRAVFVSSAVLMLIIGALLYRMMPKYAPSSSLRYGQIVGSTVRLLWNMPVVRRRAIYQALMFAAFNVFWTSVPILLAKRFGLGSHGIALFALAGCGGALAAPLAGRLADRGWGRLTTMGSAATLILGFLATLWTVKAGWLVAFAVLAALIDAAVQANQVATQKILFSGNNELRGRINAIYMASVFAGGALGSFLGAYVYHEWGWGAAALVGTSLGAIVLALFLTEPREAKSEVRSQIGST